MSKLLNLLVAEDSEDDARLLIRTLKHGGFDTRHERVESAAAMAEALQRRPWDAVVSDYNMPSFSGLDALRILRSTELDIPFILVSGTVGEELAVDALKAGASDYILKKNLSRLPSVLERELKEAAMRAGHRRAQRDLVESEARFRSLSVLSSDWFWEQDAEHRFVAFSGGDGVAGWGPDQDKAVGLHRWDLGGVIPISCNWEDHKGLLDAHAPFRNFEYQRILGDGRLQCVEASGEPIFDVNGDFTGYRGVATDITARKRGEQELQRFRMAMDVSPDSIYLTDPATMRFVYLNNTACERLGYTREQLLLLGPQDVLPMEREEISREFGDVIATGDLGLSQERPFVRSDGSKGWSELHRRALRADSETIIVTMGRDITERKQAEQALSDSRQRLDGIVKSAMDAIVTVDERKHIVLSNPAAETMFGYTAAELRGQPLDLLMPEHFRAGHSAHITEFGKAGITNRRMGALSPVSGLRKNGEEFLIEASISKDESAGQWFYTAILRDVTERKRADEKIQRLNRVYAVLSGINALIVRAHDRDELFKEACRIAVDQGGFKMAWIGIVDRVAMKIVPVASAGAEPEFLTLVKDRFSLREDTPVGNTRTARAVRDKKAVIANELKGDAAVFFSKERLERGIRSMAILPLLVSDNAVGVLALYAGEAGFFDEEEMKLLLELAGDIAFALDNIGKRERLDYLAYYDQLTGLANRTLFLERVNQSIISEQQVDGKFALAILDIERLRTVNESLGRQAGDELITLVAERLKSVGGPARIGRIGADHFSLVMGTVKGRSEAGRIVTDALQKCFGEPYQAGGTELRISARAGVALFPGDGTEAEVLLRNAEAALRKGKESGERVTFHHPEMTARVADTLALENKLRQALEKDEFVLHYQPKVDLDSRKIVGVEALIRWQNPERGLVPPAQFIPLLEETGLILQVGAWALQRATLDHGRWLQQGVPAPRIAVNVSAIQLRQRDFVEVVKEAIARGANPTAIDVEITESLLMEDVAGNIQKLKALRELGMKISIDDFGTGYSSLGYLAKLPVHTLKIDRSFIIAMLGDPDTMTLVSTIISLAHSLRLTVVAEGVEQEEQAKMLRLLRCDQMQGYLVSRPVPFDQMATLLTHEDPRSGNG